MDAATIGPIAFQKRKEQQGFSRRVRGPWNDGLGTSVVHGIVYCALTERKMVSDAELAQRITAILEKADLSTTTTTTIRLRLETELGVNLSSKKAFIRQHIDSYLEEQQANEGGAVQGEDGGEDEHEGSDVDEAEAEDDGEEREEEQGTEEEEDGKTTGGKGVRSPEPEPESKRLRAKIDRAIKSSLPKEKKKRAGGAGGLNKVCGLSPELQKIIGEKELPRTQVVKQLWEYIKEKDLQDPENRKRIRCDDALKGLFGTDSTDMFKMNKLLSKHIWPLEVTKTAESPSEGDVVEPKPKKAKKEPSSGKGRNSGFLCPRPISEKLTTFVGTGETELPRAEAVKRIWDYIKEKGLQDPSDKRTILCDDKLQDLFGCKTFIGFEVAKLLKEHFVKE